MTMKHIRMWSWVLVVGIVWFSGLAVSDAQVKASWWGAAPSQGRTHEEIRKIASILPADALVAAVGTIEDGRVEYDKLLDITSKFTRLEAETGGAGQKLPLLLLRGWEAKSGIDLREDFFGSLRGDVGVFIRAPKIPANLMNDDDAVNREMSKCWGLVVGVGEPARVEKVLRAVSGDFGGVVSHSAGTVEFRFSFKEAPGLSLYAELGESRLVLGMDRDVVRSLLSSGGDGGLAVRPDFNSARTHLEPGYRDLLWVDGPGIMAAITDLALKSGDDLGPLKAFLSRGKRSKVPLIVGFYPDGEALKVVSYGPDWDVTNLLGGMMLLNGLSW